MYIGLGVKVSVKVLLLALAIVCFFNYITGIAVLGFQVASARIRLAIASTNGIEFSSASHWATFNNILNTSLVYWKTTFFKNSNSVFIPGLLRSADLLTFVAGRAVEATTNTITITCAKWIIYTWSKSKTRRKILYINLIFNNLQQR